MKPLVLYHASCQDGFAAAWCAYKRFGDAAEYRAVNYGDDPPSDYLHGRDVYILDFSYLPEFIDMMATRADKLVLLDHHVSALDRFTEAWGGGACTPYTELITWTPCENVTIYVDQMRSGAQLAYDWFFPGANSFISSPLGPANRPWIVDYVADRDLWRWKLPDSREVNAYLRSIPHDFAAWDALRAAHEDGEAQAKMLAASLAHYELFDREATPGPWFVREVGPDDHRAISIVGPVGSGRWKNAPNLPLVIAEMRKPTLHATGPCGVCHTSGGHTDNCPVVTEIDANWNLMATARKALPDLIAEVRKVQRTPLQVAATLGVAILSAQEREVERAVKRARTATWGRHSIGIATVDFDGNPIRPTEAFVSYGPCPIVNVTENVSEVLEALSAEPPHWAVGWYQAENGSYRYSLRSSHGPDVAKIAEAFGGGGHKHAAGFESKTQVL